MAVNHGPNVFSGLIERGKKENRRRRIALPGNQVSFKIVFQQFVFREAAVVRRPHRHNEKTISAR
jgi:hypothetical protein